MNSKLILFLLSIVLIFIYYKDQIKIFILNIVIVKRGLITQNCKWWNISELLIKDSSGVELYNKYKRLYGDFAETNMFNTKLYLVTNTKYIKTILDNSPYIFGVGKLKYTFFKSFMSKNVGVSEGCPWKKRRLMNEKVLFTDKLHVYANKFNKDTQTTIETIIQPKNTVNFEDFTKIGQRMVAKIIFNEEHLPDNVFKIFTEANSIYTFYLNFKIDNKTYSNYINYIKKHIRNPNNNSLMKLCTQYENNETEIIHQIPHFIFPILGIYNSIIPRLLVLLYNHKYVLRNVIKEINKNKENYPYLRKCILETLRLNNPVVTTFRTLLKDFKFDNNYKFKKGTQFLILNNPVLREKEYFKFPNKFIPERWTTKMEHSYYSISFNQGPQRCPAKELSIYLIQLFIIHFFKFTGILKNIKKLKTKKIDIHNIPQIMNPCNISISL